MTGFITTARGDRVAYDLYGSGSGPAIIFVAGAGPYRATDPVTTETAKLAAEHGVTTLVFDRVGRGESEADGPLTLERELDAIAALLDAVGGSGVLCGHSSGCSISLKAAAAGLPVEGLALWEAPLAGDASDTQAWSDRIEQLIDAGHLEAAKEHYMKDMPPEWLEGAKASPEWPEIAAGVVSTRADSQSMAWAVAGLQQGNLGGIQVPVLAMYGTETFPEMTTAAQRIVQTLPNAAMKEMPGAMHTWEAGPMAAELAAFARVSVAAR